MCLRVPYQAQTGTRNDKTQITYSKMICRWDVLSTVMRLDGSYYCFFKKLIYVISELSSCVGIRDLMETDFIIETC